MTEKEADDIKCGDDVRLFLEGNTLFINGTGDMWNYNNSSTPWSHLSTAVKKVVIGEGVTSIGSHAFHDFSDLVSVNFSNTVTTIGDQSFYVCRRLKDVTIPVSVAYIGDSAFAECSSLTELVIPDSVTYIGEKSFAHCGLINITIPESVSFIGLNAFGGTNIRYVLYQGTVDFPDSDAFDLSQVEFLCVSPEYKNQTFCGVNVTLNQQCKNFQQRFNHCSKGTLDGNYFYSEKRKNATKWESQSNNCTTYKCDDNLGPIAWSNCESTDKETWTCENGNCVSSSRKTDKISVTLNLEEGVTSLDEHEVLAIISEQFGIDGVDITLGWVNDKHGNIVSVILYLDDENKANALSTAVNECIS